MALYNDYYGLTDRPFQLTPDPRFYFDSATHRKAMAYLGYGLAQGEGFIVVTGEVGAGKTTLVGHLMNTIDPSRLTAVKLVSTQVEGDDLLRLVAEQFGIEWEGQSKAELLRAIEQYLRDQARAGRRTLLIVDEAQNLPASAVEELRMLSNFQLGGQSLLQIFLLGQPEFRDLLHAPEMEQLRQRVIATHHLEPMLASEVEPYIRHRLALVGWKDDPKLSADAYTAVYRATGGVPRRINALMSRVLLLGAVDRLHEIDGQVVQAVVADMGMAGMDATSEIEDDQTLAAATGAKKPRRRAAATKEPQTDAPAEEAAAQAGDVEAADEASELHHVREELEDLRRVISLTTDLNGDQRGLLERLEQAEARVAAVEARSEDQEAALRRMLTLLVDWVETEEAMARAA